MTREVFVPLGLTTAGFGAPGTAGANDQPSGHRSGLLGGLRAVEPGPMADNPPVLGPAGTVHLSLEDLGRYLSVHMAGARGEETGYLSEESWHTLHTPPFGDEYAMGWGVREGLLMHAGSNTMWYMQMVMAPEADRAVIIAFNEARANRLQAPIGEDDRSLAR